MSNLYSSAVQRSTVVADLAQDELHKRLRLYQVFLNLYEHHSALLNEIFQLENLAGLPLAKTRQNYVQAIVDREVPYIITNLKEGKSQCLRQPQQIWTIGRNEGSGICIYNQYLSRCHAAIQYLQGKGFQLVDFNSTNGSYINGERIYQPRQIQDGDCIRLGTVTFSFFINMSTQVLPTVAAELLMQLVPKQDNLTTQIPQYASRKTKSLALDSGYSSEKLQKPNVSDRPLAGISILEQYFTAHQNSEILDCFLSQNKSYSE